jgi:uncharacterized membrane protein
MEQGVARSLARRTSAMSLLLAAALIASLLAMLGLYAVGFVPGDRTEARDRDQARAWCAGR